MTTEQKDDRRGSMVSVRFGGDEIERVRSAAERRGSSVSAYIREATLGNHQRPVAQVGSSNAAVDPASSQTLTYGTSKPVPGSRSVE